jgi:hypothetical protein
MNKNIFPLLFLFNILCYSQLHSEDNVIFYDYCPFECCQFGSWIIKDNINVYAEEGDTNSINFRLSNNDTILAETGNLHYLRVGKVVVIKNIYEYEIDDTLAVFNCIEGEFLVKHNGRENYVNVFWPIDNDLTKTGYSGEMILSPETVWWIKIKSIKGEGWIRLENKTPYCFRIDEEISGMDACE